MSYLEEIQQRNISSLQKETVETIEENLLSAFGHAFNQKHKEKLDRIFSLLKETPKVSDMLSEIISELEWTFYNHGRATEKLLEELE